jgi:hypothetical protein
METQIKTKVVNVSFLIKNLHEHDNLDMFTMNLEIDLLNRRVYGVGEISNNVSKSKLLSTVVYGDYMVLNSSKISINIDGYEKALWPPKRKSEEMLLMNVILIIILDQNWEEGTAVLEYKDLLGKWHYLEEARVTVSYDNSIFNTNF